MKGDQLGVGGSVFIILYQLTNFKVHSFNTFGNINDFKYLLPKFTKGNNSVKNNLIKKKTFNLLIIFYQRTNFQAPGHNTFRDILITSFQCQNLQKGNN